MSPLSVMIKSSNEFLNLAHLTGDQDWKLIWQWNEQRGEIKAVFHLLSVLLCDDAILTEKSKFK